MAEAGAVRRVWRAGSSSSMLRWAIVNACAVHFALSTTWRRCLGLLKRRGLMRATRTEAQP